MKLSTMLREGAALLEAPKTQIPWKNPDFIEKMKEHGATPATPQYAVIPMAKNLGVTLKPTDAVKFLRMLADTFSRADWDRAYRLGVAEPPLFNK